jgi:hypothetical protein
MSMTTLSNASNLPYFLLFLALPSRILKAWRRKQKEEKASREGIANLSKPKSITTVLSARSWHSAPPRVGSFLSGFFMFVTVGLEKTIYERGGGT